MEVHAIVIFLLIILLIKELRKPNWSWSIYAIWNSSFLSHNRQHGAHALMLPNFLWWCQRQSGCILDRRLLPFACLTINIQTHSSQN
jgi:hypothetical protein